MIINNASISNNILIELNPTFSLLKEKSRNKTNVPVVSDIQQFPLLRHKLEINNRMEITGLCQEIEFLNEQLSEDFNISGYCSQFKFYNWLKVIESIVGKDFKKGLLVHILI